MNERELENNLLLQSKTLLMKVRHDLFNSILNLRCSIQNFEKGLSNNTELCEELHDTLTQLERVSKHLKLM